MSDSFAGASSSCVAAWHCVLVYDMSCPSLTTRCGSPFVSELPAVQARLVLRCCANRMNDLEMLRFCSSYTGYVVYCLTCIKPILILLTTPPAFRLHARSSHVQAIRAFQRYRPLYSLAELVESRVESIHGASRRCTGGLLQCRVFKAMVGPSQVSFRSLLQRAVSNVASLTLALPPCCAPSESQPSLARPSTAAPLRPLHSLVVVTQFLHWLFIVVVRSNRPQVPGLAFSELPLTN